MRVPRRNALQDSRTRRGRLGYRGHHRAGRRRGAGAAGAHRDRGAGAPGSAPEAE